MSRIGGVLVANYLRLQPLRALLAVWLAASAFSALTMFGFHQEDEVGQITAFYLHKAGVVSADELPWEHLHAARPWIQPAFYYALFGSAISSGGYNHLYFERLSFVISFFLVAVATIAFGSLLTSGLERPASSRSLLGVVAVTCVWFLPSFVLRHSSEALAATLLIVFLWMWQRGENRGGLYTAAAGAIAAIAFWVRFHRGFFFLGWFLALAGIRGRRGSLGSIVQAALAFGSVCGLMVLVDWWGYGRVEFTPWNYFHEQVLKDVAGYFGTSGVVWYVVEGSLALLNPLFFVWLAVAISKSWGDRFSRSISCGIGLFFLVHSLTPHRELRFLIPVLPLAMLLVARYYLTRDGETTWDRRLAHPWYLRVVVGLNVAAFLLFAASGTKSPRNQVEFALWKADTPATVFSATNLFQHFDRALDDPPFFETRPEDGFLISRFRKPPNLDYVYSPPNRFSEACSSEPRAYVLITSDQSDRGGSLIESQEIVSTAEFPPAWLAGLLSRTRTWRFKLVRCRDLPG